MSNTRILFDGTIFEGQAYGGISRYFVELTRELNALDGCSASVVAPFHVNAHLSELARDKAYLGKILGVNAKKRRYTGRARYRSNVALTQAAALLLRPTIFHKTYHSARWHRLPESTRKVTTIHDMIYEILGDELPETDTLKAWRRQDLDASDLIICVSENTKKDLLKYYDVDEAKINVVYHGCSITRLGAANSAAITAAIGERPYILYVGKRGSYKNFSALAAAWGKTPSLKSAFSLVCFGGGPLDDAEYREYRKFGVAVDDIHHVVGDDQTLASLYKNAAVFVYPSLYEGFGFPPLEAMAQECPVVCANASCIPEIVGDAGCYFDPSSPEALADALTRLLGDTSLQKTLRQNGHGRVAEFTWKKCALNTLNAYRSIGE